MTRDEPEWVRHALWWHVYPLGFTGAPVRPATDDERAPAHRLRHLEPWLDHLVDLGLNGLLLGPVFASETHGYDTVDHYRLDPRLGDEADVDRLVAACRERGIRLLFDGVFNHVARIHPAFAEVEAHGRDAATANLFRIHWDSYEPGGPVPADVFEGHEALVELDHSSPAVVDEVTDVMTYWLERGIDGWRLDAAYAVPPQFWQAVLPRVRERHPDAWFLGEVIHGDYSQLVAGSGMDTVTQYELWQGIWHGIADRNLFETEHALGRHRGMLETFVPATFVGNHDVTRIASAVGEDLVPHAVAILLTVAGTPAVYAGDELGMTGVKEDRLGGDDAVRPAFPAQPPGPGDLADHPIWRAHRDLIAVRRRNPWLHEAATDVVDVAHTWLVLRTGTDGAAVVTALNIADDGARLPAADATVLLAGSGELDEHAATVTVPPRGWAVLGAGEAADVS
ncbi:alpha-amylase family glycosyl hydrolase [Georgenia deserti]|uniref:Alpha-amylase family glycosyl hydrolase n=1 Tax=Georgenia deserti TaxID=2093781 RepID=A0ABW4L739_9MICO